MKRAKTLLLLLLTLAFGLCMALATTAMANVTEDPTAFTITYEQAEGGGNFFDRRPASSSSWGDAFDSETSSFRVADRGELRFGNTNGMYKNFVLKMTVDPGMLNEWSQLRIWYRVYDQFNWAGTCISFRQTAEGVNTVQLMNSGEDGTNNYVALTEAATLTQSGPLELRLVSLETRAALFIGGEKVLETNQIKAGDIGYFDIETWDTQAKLYFPIECTLGATEDDFLEEGAGDLKAVQDAAIAELEDYKNPADYRAPQQAALEAEIASGTAAIRQAEDADGVAAALAAAKAKIDAIKTDAQLTEEEEALAGAELEEAQTLAKTQLENYVQLSAYRPAQQEEVTAAIAAGKTAIDEATDAEGVAAALAAAKANIDKIKTDAQLTEEEEASSKVICEDGHYLANFENFALNDTDGTAEAQNTILDFNYTTAIANDVSTGKPLFSQTSNDGEKVIYFGSDFSAAPGSADTWDDFTLTVNLRASYLSNDWSWAKILFRAQDNRSSAAAITANATQRNCYKFNFKHNTVWLTKDVEGKETTIAAANVPFRNNTFYEVKIVAEGEYIACFIDGEKIMEVNDSSFTVGLFGVCTWQTAYAIRNIEIVDSVSAEDKNAALVEKCTDLDIAGSGFSVEDWYTVSDAGSQDILRLVSVDGVRRLRNDVSSGQTTVLFGNADLQNVWMTVKFSISDAGNSGWLYRLLFRSNGWATNSYYVEVTAGGLSLVRCEDDAITALGAYSRAMAGDTEYKIDVTALNGAIKVYIDDVLVIDVNDTGFGNNAFGKLMMGPAGIVAWNTGYEVTQLGYTAFTGTEYSGNGQTDIDEEPPAVTITMPDTAAPGTVTVSYEATDNNTPSESLTVRISVTKDGENVRVAGGKFNAAEEGEYVVTVTVTDAAGLTGSATKTITVSAAAQTPEDPGEGDGSGGCGGCNSAAGIGAGALAVGGAVLLALGALLAVRARRER